MRGEYIRNTDPQSRRASELVDLLDVSKYPSDNVIIGGDAALNGWLRGTTIAGINATQFTADNVRFEFSSAGACSLIKSSDAPTVDQIGCLTDSFEIDITTPDASVGASDIVTINFGVEGYNWRRLAQRSFCFNFWVKTNKTGIYCALVNNSNADRCFVREFTVNEADTWEYKSVLIDPSPSSGTWLYTNGVGARLHIVLMCGTDRHTTAGEWQTSNVSATSNQVNLFDNVNNYMRIAIPYTNLGTIPAAYVQRSIQLENLLLSRYIREIGSQISAIAQSTTTAGYGLQYFPPMRATPTTITLTTTTPSLRDGSANVNGSSSTITSTANSGVNGTFVFVDGFTGLTQHRAYLSLTPNPFRVEAEV